MRVKILMETMQDKETNQKTASSVEPTINTGEALLYRRIQAAMRARIIGGDWAAGQSIPNRTHLCKEFGTTRVTLDKSVQGLVAEGLLRSAGRIGTFVSLPEEIAARTLRIGVILASNTIETHDMVPYHDNFYFGPLFQGIRSAVSAKPVETIFTLLYHTEYLRFCRDSTLDGLILIAPRNEQIPAFHALYQEGIFFVAAGISSTDSADAEIPCQDTDNRQGARDAVRHLLDLGHQDITIVSLVTTNSNLNNRLQGFRHAIAGAGLTLNPSNVFLMAEQDENRFEELMSDWVTRSLATGTLPTAVFVCDYPMSLTMLRVLRRHHLRVPEDISVVGFDDPLSAEHLTPPLTTVRQPLSQMGSRAAERLLAGIRGGQPPRGGELLRTELIVRESTGRAPAAQPASSPFAVYGK
jgi:DNA-binding LacI/PurR family transcriptional regulator